MKLIPRQKIWLGLVVATNLALWVIPSDVVKQIAQDRQTMLGRYSRTHFYWILGVAAISAISFYIDWSKGQEYKRRWFRVIASLSMFFLGLSVIDFFLRTDTQQHYVRDTIAYHRPPNASLELDFVDKPNAYRTYPNAPEGFGTVRCRLRTDARGYRNQNASDQYDIVTLGDSFTEGSSVSDEHAWPVLLAKRIGQTVYNLGMSGYDPLHYRESLKEVGLSLKPKIVICMIYEGNDFRSAKTDRKRMDPSYSAQFKRYTERSPLLKGLDRLLIQAFAPIGRNGDVTGSELLDWMPLRVPDGEDSKAYAFAPKQLRDLYESRERFSANKHWLNPRRQIGEMSKLCREANTSYVVVYAPTKAHVVLPLSAKNLTADKVRSFTALKYKKPLPQPEVFLQNLLERAGARESVVKDWCDREGIAFFSLTEKLRAAAKTGKQVYYTYDQHWTPTGCEVVAEAVAEFLQSELPSDTH